MNLVRRSLLTLLVSFAAFFASKAMALDVQAHFRFRELAPHAYDFQASFNPETEILTLKIGLEPLSLPEIMDQPISFSKAVNSDFVLLELPEFNIGCDQVVQHQFEFSPDLPYHLLLVSLKGPACGNELLRTPVDQTRIRFTNVPIGEEKLESFSLILHR